MPVNAGPWDGAYGSCGLSQDTWDRPSSNPTLGCNTFHLASSLCSTMEQAPSPSLGGESGSSEVRGGKRRGRTGVTSSPDGATYPNMTQGHSAPRQLPKLYFEEALTVGILSLSCGTKETVLYSAKELGSVQGLKTTDCPSQTQPMLHRHIPPAPSCRSPAMALHCFLAFIPCKPSQ